MCEKVRVIKKRCASVRNALVLEALMRFQRIAAVVATSGVLTGILWTNKDRYVMKKAKAASNKLDIDEALEKYGSGKHKWNYNWDHRAPASKEKNDTDGEKEEKNSVATRHLILIRHGQYEQHHKDSDMKKLTELGRRQAKATGERLKQLDENYTILYFSTMPRATETGKIISECLPGVPTKSCDLMREGAPYPPDPPSKNWRPQYNEFFRDGSRIEAAFRHYFHRAPPSQTEDSTEILVCHANVIRYFVCRALQLPPEAWLRMSLANGSITRMTIRPSGTVSLRALGDSGHLPKDMITFS